MPPSLCALDLESVRGIIGGERGEEEEEEAPALVLAVGVAYLMEESVVSVKERG